MRLNEPPGSKFKRVCAYFPNIKIPNKNITPGEVQLIYTHVSVGNKFLGENVTTFALSGSLEAPTVTLLAKVVVLEGYK